MLGVCVVREASTDLEPRIIDIRRDLWRSSSQMPGSKQVSSSRLLRALPGSVLIISKDGESTTSAGNLFQHLTILTVRKVFSYGFVELSVFEFVPIVSSFTGYR